MTLGSMVRVTRLWCCCMAAGWWAGWGWGRVYHLPLVLPREARRGGEQQRGALGSWADL